MSNVFVIIKMCYMDNQWYDISCATLYIRLAAFHPNHVQLIILYSLCYTCVFLTNIIVCSYLTLRIELRCRALENWMLRRDLNRQGGSDGEWRVFIVLSTSIILNKIKKNTLGGYVECTICEYCTQNLGIKTWRIYTTLKNNKSVWKYS